MLITLQSKVEQIKVQGLLKSLLLQAASVDKLTQVNSDCLLIGGILF